MARRNLSKAELERRGKVRRRIFAILAATGALYILVPLLLGDMGIVKYFGMLANQRALSEEIRSLVKENDRLKQEIEVLRTDQTRIESLAREQLGLVKKGELVYQFEPRDR